MNEDDYTKSARTPSRYRKVEVRTWGDQKFRKLSALPPCGQGLWLFLITGPHTSPIPGLFRAGRAGMAEELDWELEAFDKAFQEVFQQGMVKADFKARVMWVPNAIKHNRPESPNVVKSWAAEFDLIPECDLKREAMEHLRASVHALGEAFGKAFDMTFGKPSRKAMPNQEQEQEQEIKEAIASSSPDGAGEVDAGAGEESEETEQGDDEPAGLPACPHREILALFAERLPELPQPKPELWEGQRAKNLAARWRWSLKATKGNGDRYATDKASAMAFFSRFFAFVAGSDFLTGRDGRWSGCDLAWLVKQENFAKVMQGNYANREAA